MDKPRVGDTIVDYSNHVERRGVVEALSTERDAHLLWYKPDESSRSWNGQTVCINVGACKVVKAAPVVKHPRLERWSTIYPDRSCGVFYISKENCEHYDGGKDRPMVHFVELREGEGIVNLDELMAVRDSMMVFAEFIKVEGSV